MNEPAGWHRLAVRITLGPEERADVFTVSGWVNATFPGLAVTPTVRGGAIAAVAPGRGWSITHVASGREIAAGLTEVMARRRAERLAPIAKWEASMAELVQSPGLFSQVEGIVAGRLGGMVPAKLRPSRATECERKATRYLLEALRIHENRADDANAARIRGALSYLPQ